MDFLNSFSDCPGGLQFYWIVALAASVVFVIQAVMTFIGFDSDAALDGGGADFDADGFHIVSVKTLTCFLLGFGWTGVLFWNQIASRLSLGFIAGAVGLLFMLLIAVLLRQVMKLNKDNTFNARQTVGMSAEVYLRIPPKRTETGKITVSVNGSLHELEALTAGDELIPTGAKVRITDVVEGDTVLVEKL